MIIKEPNVFCAPIFLMLVFMSGCYVAPQSCDSQAARQLESLKEQNRLLGRIANSLEKLEQIVPVNKPVVIYQEPRIDYQDRVVQ